ncbi:MAG TPA: MFS transporter [Myxococcota bacterium]|nr:MFS transporter [Myxococcota bacterium]
MSDGTHGSLAALRERDFARFAAARFLATLAWQMLGVAVGYQVYALTADPLALGFVGLAQFLPFIAQVLPAGQLADRADRRRVLMGAYVAEALCAAVLLAFTLSGNAHIWPIYAAMALLGSGRAFWMPASQAITPSLVPTALFPSAIAINSTLFQTAVIGGPALGGLLYVAGPAVVYGTSLAMFLCVIALIATIRPRRAQASESVGGREVLEGLRFVLRQRVVLGAISLDLFAVLFGGATALLPMVAADVLHVGPIGLGVLRSAPAVGAALTAGALALRPVRQHVGRWLFGGVALFGAATVVFGVSRSLPLSLGALALLGAGDMLSVYVRHLLVQLETPDAIRGKVSAVNSMFIGASNELGEFESGVTARWLGLVPAIVVGGIATLLVCAAFMRLFPEMRKMDRFPEPAA